MTSRYRISVGGVQLDTLDKNLLILDIGYANPDRNVKKQTAANLNGVDIADTYVGEGRVTVTFELHIYDVAKRNEACQKVNAWAAKGGSLVTNDRSGQYLQNVTCEQYADISSAKNWTDPLTLVFATTNNPYWVASKAKSVSMTGKSASGTLSMDGNTGSALVGVTVTANESISSLQMTCGSTTIKLTGISVASGKQVIVDYINSRFIRIRANGSSVMAKLDRSSSDNLLAKCGASNKVSISANGKVTASFSARGCFLW